MVWPHPGFLLLLMAGSATPWRCEPWGTASLHVVMWGCIVLLAAPCSSKNIKQFVNNGKGTGKGVYAFLLS